MLANGATTLWEHWALSDNTYSHNHPMFGSISQWFFNWLGGIQPAPERGRLRPDRHPAAAGRWPRLGASHRTGRSGAWWCRTGRATRGPIEWQVTIPANATATIFLPAGGLDEIREGPAGGVPARRAEGVRDARMVGQHAVFTVGSGTYRFTARHTRVH